MPIAGVDIAEEYRKLYGFDAPMQQIYNTLSIMSERGWVLRQDRPDFKNQRVYLMTAAGSLVWHDAKWKFAKAAHIKAQKPKKQPTNWFKR